MSLLHRPTRLPALWLLLTGVCYTAVLVSPAAFWPAAFAAMFGIPAVLAANTLLLFWALRKRWHRYWWEVALFCLLAGYPFFRATFAWGMPATALPGQKTLRVISYNTGNFLGHGRNLDEKRVDARRMLRWLAREQADVLILQELFNYADVPEFRALHALKKAGYRYKYWSRHTHHADTTGAGMVVLAKRMLRKGKVCFARPLSNNQILRVDYLTEGGDTLRILNAHLESIRLTYEDMALKRTPKRILGNIRRTLFKMREAYIHRAKQVETLHNEIEASPYPILLCGDFNDTPYSYSYWRIRASLRNAFEQAGTGLGNTYNGKFRAGLRIDQQFYSSPMQCLHLSVVDSLNYSDHFALDGTYLLPESD